MRNTYLPKIAVSVHHRRLAEHLSIVTNKLEIITPLNFQQTRSLTVMVFEKRAL